MSSTDQLEAFRSFILTPIEYHITKSDYHVTLFLDHLLERYEYVRGEARKNYEEYLSEDDDFSLFFSDMLKKIEATEGSIFLSNSDGITYLPLGNLIDKFGSGIHLYSYHIFRVIQDVKDCFASYIPKLNQSSERFTPIPSFNAKSKIAAYNVFPELMKHGYIEGDTHIETFASIFRGEEIYTKVVWTSKISYLVYFIRTLESKKCIDDLDDDIWLVTQKCFTIKDIENLTVKKLRHAFKTRKTTVLDEIVELFAKSK
jgi:hypothetical protein